MTFYRTMKFHKLQSLKNISHNQYYKMPQDYKVQIHDHAKAIKYSLKVSNDEYILHCAEQQGNELPFSCRNGACTTCAVKILYGDIYQPEAMGLSPELKEKGYALLCVSYACSDLEVEIQEEDKVYELQFGKFFAKGYVKVGLTFDED